MKIKGFNKWFEFENSYYFGMNCFIIVLVYVFMFYIIKWVYDCIYVLCIVVKYEIWFCCCYLFVLV